MERRILPAKQAVADLFDKIRLKLFRYVPLPIAGWRLRDVDGRPTKANKRLASEIGITNPKRVKRQPPRPAMKPMTGGPMTYDRPPQAIINPIAFALFSKGRCSPISVTTIGATIAVPTPLRGYDISIKVKLEAKEQPRAEMLTNNRPIISKDLCLNRTFKTPMNNAKMTAAMEETALICPMTPTEHSNVRAMSIRRSPVRTPRGPVAK